MTCGISNLLFVSSPLLLPLLPLFCPREKKILTFSQRSRSFYSYVAPPSPSSPQIKTTDTDRVGWNRLQPPASSSMSTSYGTISYNAGLGLIRRLFVLAIIGEFLVVLCFFEKGLNLNVGVGRYRLVSIYPTRFSQCVNGDKGVFYSKCMFNVVLVTQSLERHPDNFISLLGSHLFSCRSVRYILPF